MVTQAEYVSKNAAMEIAERDPFTAERYRQFGRKLRPGVTTVLDVGSGPGRGGIALKALRPALRIYGLDCVPSRIDRLPAEAYAGGYCGFSTASGIPDASVDAIVAGEFIEHLTYADGIASLAEFARILKPAGQILLTTPYPDYIRLLLTGGTTVGGAHLSAHYPRQLAVMLRDAGFVNVAWCGSGKVSRYVGESLPIWCYGSFLIQAELPADGQPAAG